MSVAREKVGFFERIGYGFGDLASCLFWQTFTVFLLFFYTDVFGITAAAAATMMGAVRVVDLFADPIMGMIGDRTQTRWGKFRPYLLWMAVPFGVIGFLTFYAPSLSPVAKLTYAYVTYGAMMLVYTAINIPYGALMGVITPDSLVRTRLSSYRFLGAFTGNLVVQTFTLGLVKYLGGGVERIGFRWTMAIYAASATLLFLGTFALTRERVQPARDQQTSFLRDLGDLMRNRPWLVLCVVGICANTWAVLKMAALPYFFKYYLGDDAGIAQLLFPDDGWLVPWLLGTLPAALGSRIVGLLRFMFTGVAGFMLWGTIGNITGVLATGWMTKHLGKRNLYVVSMLINVITTAVYFLAGPKDMVFLYAMNIVGGFASGPVSPLIWALYADTADYSEWKTGRRATGLVFSAGTFAQKMGWTVGGSLAGYLLAFYGFQANIAQTVGSLFGIRLLVSVIPAIASLLAAVAILFYAISEKLQKQISTELTERRAKAGVVPATA
jgi:GPH family glycoside/pentoside/hexuronide:cation symporter